jgi:predicted metal-dependent hydrolase
MPSMNKRERISDFLRSLEPASPEASSQDYYAAFFQLWNVQKYYEAHDVLEQLWLVEKNAELARFYKALIQAAGAFVHLQKNFEHPSHAKHSRRLPPATRLFELALRNLDGLPNEFQALDLMHFRKLLEQYRKEIVAADFKRNPWLPEKAPQLVLPD